MSTPDGENDAFASERSDFAIAEVAHVLGIPMPTLRSWELRYGLPTTQRVSGKHRRYSQADLHTLRLMRDEIARGKRASAAAESVRLLLGLTGPAAEFVDSVLAASTRSDPIAVREQLDLASRTLGLGPCVDDVLMPAMRQVGAWWQSGRCDVEQERLTTEAVRGWLESVSSLAPTPTQSRPVLLACGPTDLHTVGLESLAVLLRYSNCACRLLGARTAMIALSTAIRANDAAAAVVVSHLNSGRQRAIQTLRAVSDFDVDLFYAGNAFASPRSRSGVPGTYLGSRLQDARDLILNALAPGVG